MWLPSLFSLPIHLRPEASADFPTAMNVKITITIRIEAPVPRSAKTVSTARGFGVGSGSSDRHARLAKEQVD